jgi:hypothetical protein
MQSWYLYLNDVSQHQFRTRNAPTKTQQTRSDGSSLDGSFIGETMLARLQGIARPLVRHVGVKERQK